MDEWFKRYVSRQIDKQRCKHAGCNTLHLYQGQSINCCHKVDIGVTVCAKQL